MSVALLLLAAAPAAAAERGYSVTSFDRVRVEGPFEVVLTTGKAVSARASGSAEAIERLSLRVEGRTMLIRPGLSAWGGYPGKQSGPPRILTVEGSGQISVGALDADNASLAVAGSGAIEAAGRGKQASAVARGTAEIRAAGLAVSDLTLASESAGAVTMNASRSARVSVMGPGPVTVEGNAACEVKKLGSGPVSCGN